MSTVGTRARNIVFSNTNASDIIVKLGGLAHLVDTQEKRAHASIAVPGLYNDDGAIRRVFDNHCTNH